MMKVTDIDAGFILRGGWGGGGGDEPGYVSMLPPKPFQSKQFKKIILNSYKFCFNNKK